jgi:hypothetical protein
MLGSLFYSPYSWHIFVRKLFEISGRQNTSVYRTTCEKSRYCYGVVGPAVAQTVPKITTYGDDADNFLNAYASNLKT